MSTSKVQAVLFYKHVASWGTKICHTHTPTNMDGKFDAKADVERLLKRDPTIQRENIIGLVYMCDNIPLGTMYDLLDLFGSELQYEPKCLPSVFDVRCYYKWFEHCQDYEWKTDHCKYYEPWVDGTYRGPKDNSNNKCEISK